MFIKVFWDFFCVRHHEVDHVDHSFRFFCAEMTVQVHCFMLVINYDLIDSKNFRIQVAIIAGAI